MVLIEEQQSSLYSEITWEWQPERHSLSLPLSSQQQGSSSTNTIKKQQLVEQVYFIIRGNSGKIRTTDLDRIIGNKQDVRFAITRMTVSGRIRRKRGLGSSGIEYYYHDIYRKTSCSEKLMDETQNT